MNKEAIVTGNWHNSPGVIMTNTGHLPVNCLSQFA